MTETWKTKKREWKKGKKKKHDVQSMAAWDEPNICSSHRPVVKLWVLAFVECVKLCLDTIWYNVINASGYSRVFSLWWCKKTARSQVHRELARPLDEVSFANTCVQLIFPNPFGSSCDSHHSIWIDWKTRHIQFRLSWTTACRRRTILLHGSSHFFRLCLG